ncbi:Hsp20/alpha crystallin family protein [Planctomicrobium sp. SH664]|uniref:Hsp20/alpha crystallin family protein n=1 Tax=Planctomicrobium sp. SH664 TaxID=3448125 RepID=UPI003F5AF60D
MIDLRIFPNPTLNAISAALKTTPKSHYDTHSRAPQRLQFHKQLIQNNLQHKNRLRTNWHATCKKNWHCQSGPTNHAKVARTREGDKSMMTANRIHHLLNQFPTVSEFFHDQWLKPAASALPAQLWAKEDGVVIELELPGQQLEDFTVQAERNKISVEVTRGHYPADSDLHFRIRERKSPASGAEFHLPFQVQPELTEVVYQQGILRITVRQPAEDQPRRLPVRGTEN